ncbi:gamma-glutamyl-gamma-aminobutyrate hydrolase family protein [bacterium]|nr:gamma-glutamyl-gamma-aminobutyrate hydrolase family protein [bacterium]
MILLLLTGSAPPSSNQDYRELFGQALGVEPVVADARLGEFPEGDWSGIVITGSAFSTYEQLEWIAPAEEFLRRQAARNVPIYGVCFGHQLLAQAFGGKVERCPNGWELGSGQVRLNSSGLQDPLFEGLPEDLTVQQSHADVVTELPEGAEILAGNSHWGVQAFRLGPRIWGTQFHPEFTTETMAAAVERVSGLLEADEEFKQTRLRAIQPAFEARACLANFARLVRPALQPEV